MFLARRVIKLLRPAHASCLNRGVTITKQLFRHRLGVGHYVFAAVLLVRIVALTRLSASAFLLPMRGDMHFYDNWAQRILHGELTDHLAFYGLPLYAYFLALIYKLVGYGPFVPGLLQACIDALTAVIVYRLGVHIFSSLPVESRETGNNSLELVSRNRGHFVGVAAALAWALFLPAMTTIVRPSSRLGWLR